MIYTFYSYKGGVGRSMALVNIAELMYRAGLKVVVVDWDLETPGLERFFASDSADFSERPGILDMLLDYKDKLLHLDPSDQTPFFPVHNIQKEYAIEIYPDERPVRLWLLPAGRRKKGKFTEYINRVLTFDWQDFYDHWEGEIYLEWLRGQLEELADADVVLIDSRAGVNEMAGVCTYQLADVVVMFCGANRQHMEGTRHMLERFHHPRLQELRGGDPLKTLVVPARIETDSETEQRDEIYRRFVEYFEPFIPDEPEYKQFSFKDLEVPYTPACAFEEIIAVNQADDESVAKIRRAYNNLLQALAQLAPADSPVRKQLQDREIMDIKWITTPAEPKIEPEYGPMPVDSKFYIERAEDERCWSEIKKSEATTIFIQGPPQMGKSSLMLRMLHRAKTELDKPSAFIDFKEFSKEALEDETSLFQKFCWVIGNELDVPSAIDEYWKGQRNHIFKCTRYLSEHIIPTINKPFILALDNLEVIGNNLFRDLLGMLRTWHNSRAGDENFRKVTILLSSSPEAMSWNMFNQSSFNVAEFILLQDFSPEQVRKLNARYSSLLNEDQLDELMSYTNGHPFLTKRIFDLLATDQIRLDKLPAQLSEDIEIKKHFHCYSDKIEIPHAKEFLTSIHKKGAYEKSLTYYRVKDIGLVREEGPEVVPRNKMYAIYFEEQVSRN